MPLLGCLVLQVFPIQLDPELAQGIDLQHPFGRGLRLQLGAERGLQRGGRGVEVDAGKFQLEADAAAAAVVAVDAGR